MIRAMTEFDLVNFPFLDGDFSHSSSYGMCVSQRFSAFLNLFGLLECLVILADFNACNKSLTAKLLQQGYRYHKLRKTFSKFYRRHN